MSSYNTFFKNHVAFTCELVQSVYLCIGLPCWARSVIVSVVFKRLRSQLRKNKDKTESVYGPYPAKKKIERMFISVTPNTGVILTVEGKK